MTSRGVIGAYQGRSNSQSISEIARKNAPPNPKSVDTATAVFMSGAIASSLIAVMAGSFTLWLFGVVITLFATVLAVVLVKDEEGVSDEYNRQWYCYKCGRNFHEPMSHEPIDRRGEVSPISRHPDFAQRVRSPVQKAKSLTDRDSQGLREIQERSAADGSFDPMVPKPLDLGIVSRLASQGLLLWDEETDTFRIVDPAAFNGPAEKGDD